MSNIYEEGAIKLLEKKYNELFCPFHDCKKSFPTPWEQYVVRKNAKNLDVYKCPNCNREFTVDDMGVNAVRVANLKNSVFVWFDTRTRKRVFTVHGDTIFSDGENYYIHVPVLILNKPNLRMFSADASFDDKQIDDAIINYLVVEAKAQTTKKYNKR